MILNAGKEDGYLAHVLKLLIYNGTSLVRLSSMALHYFKKKYIGRGEPDIFAS